MCVTSPPAKMNAASCLILITILSPVAALTLPDVILPTTSGSQDIAPPSLEPVKLSDVENEHTRYALIYHWCISYHYCKKPSRKPEDMEVDEIKAVICNPVRQIKNFYNMDGANCDLTTELLNIMSQPRCAREDEETCTSDKCRRERRWTRMGSATWRNMPVSYMIKTPLSSPTLSVTDQEALLQFCARLWSDNSGLSMQFKRNSARANIEVSFVYLDGPWGTVGRGLSPSNNGISYQRLDSSEKWKRNRNDPSQGVSMQWAMCHEMGHNLGLGHSRDSNAIMYPTGVGQDDSRLSSDDLKGIQALYGGPGKKMPSNSSLLPPRSASGHAPLVNPSQNSQRQQEPSPDRNSQRRSSWNHPFNLLRRFQRRRPSF